MLLVYLWFGFEFGLFALVMYVFMSRFWADFVIFGFG